MASIHVSCMPKLSLCSYWKPKTLRGTSVLQTLQALVSDKHGLLWGSIASAGGTICDRQGMSQEEPVSAGCQVPGRKVPDCLCRWEPQCSRRNFSKCGL